MLLSSKVEDGVKNGTDRQAQGLTISMAAVICSRRRTQFKKRQIITRTRCK